MAKEKKATGDAPKKRTPRSKAPVAAAQETIQQPPDNGNAVQTSGNGSNGSSTSERGISLQVRTPDELVRRRAYELWEQRGRQHGKDADDWYRAESEVRGKSA
jgi:oligoendopeptidase F